jgi:hypothetical protein
MVRASRPLTFTLSTPSPHSHPLALPARPREDVPPVTHGWAHVATPIGYSATCGVRTPCCELVRRECPVHRTLSPYLHVHVRERPAYQFTSKCCLHLPSRGQLRLERRAARHVRFGG